MARAAKISNPFEQSFMFHMIRDFFLLLVLVATVEMGIRYALVRYDYASKEQARIDQAAQKLANDVKSIMLNSGGHWLLKLCTPYSIETLMSWALLFLSRHLKSQWRP